MGSLGGTLYALDARTGAERWHFTGAGEITGSAAVVNDIVYTPDGSGALVALDVDDGSELWRANIDVASFGSSSPVVADGIVYVASVDGNAYGFDAVTGEERWSWHGTEPARGITIGDGVAYIGAEDRRLHAVSLADSHELWYVQTSASALSSSIVDGDSVYVTNQLGAADLVSELFAIDAASGEVQWKFRTPSGHQVLAGAVADGVIYVPTDGHGVYALSTADGREYWRADTFDSHTAIALVDNTLFVSTFEGFLVALRSTTGAELWRTPISPGTEWGTAVTGGMIFQADNAGTVYAFGSAATGAIPSPSAMPSPSSKPLPAAFELVETFTAEAPRGMDLGPDGNLYVANVDDIRTPGGTDEVLVLTPDGEIVRRWGERGTGPGQFDFQRRGGDDPIAGVSVDRDFVYVTDPLNYRL